MKDVRKSKLIHRVSLLFTVLEVLILLEDHISLPDFHYYCGRIHCKVANLAILSN